MKTCLFNLPYPTRIIRRYNCTYYAQNFLSSSLELMYLGSVIKEWKKDNCILIDAIAQHLNLNNIIKMLKVYQPGLLVFMAGIESFFEGIHTIEKIKLTFSSIKIVYIKYLPSISPKETLEDNPAIDYVIMNESELSFSEIYDEIKKGCPANVSTKGVAKRYIFK